jgi:hypothetical protein
MAASAVEWRRPGVGGQRIIARTSHERCETARSKG